MVGKDEPTFHAFKEEISRKHFLKLMGAGSLFLGLGTLGISNLLKTFGEASASKMGSPVISERNSSNTMFRAGGSESNPNGMSIRPFHVNIPEAELTELRRRINATRWPERERVTDQSQGVQLATIQKLARYWTTEHDWQVVASGVNVVHREDRAVDRARLGRSDPLAEDD
jgi:Epoxide hydrolase N terminus